MSAAAAESQGIETSDWMRPGVAQANQIVSPSGDFLPIETRLAKRYSHAKQTLRSKVAPSAFDPLRACQSSDPLMSGCRLPAEGRTEDWPMLHEVETALSMAALLPDAVDVRSFAKPYALVVEAHLHPADVIAHDE
jgi:hypothetical protein